jgi:hypothetical protein
MGKMKDAAKRLTGRIDQYQETLTFAEAGGQLDSGSVFKEKELEKSTPRLLVVGRESTFSREVIDYALEMAQRMSYEILALNTAPLSCETFKIFPSSQKKLCEDFQSLSESNVMKFREKAAKAGLPFEHVVKFSEPDAALEEIKREYHDIEFVVSEEAERQIADRVEEGIRARKEIFVYSMV